MKIILSSRRHHYVAIVSIFLIIVAFIAGTVSCSCRDGGEEEEEEKIPIYITDWDDLNTNRDKLGADYVWILENDLDRDSDGWEELASETANEGKGWEPIGAEGNVFKGTFDGGGHTISDLYIYRPDKDEVGLFGRVQGSDEGGVIKNLGLEAVNVTGKKFVGALVGYSWKGKLDSDTRPPNSKTYSSGIVTGENNVGGLVGNNFDGTVNQCESSADVLIRVAPGEKRWRAGGLVGLNSGPVLNCNYNGEVNGDRQVGGLVGLNERTLTEVGRVEDCGGAYSVNGTRICGGVAGQNMGDLRRNSYCCWVNGNYTEIGGGLTALNEGDVGNADSYDTALPGCYIGGVVGVNGEEGIVEDCIADATVVGVQYVGGFAGENRGEATGCNSSGYVTGSDDVGRFVGYNTGTVSNPESTSCVTGAIDCGPLVGRNEGRILYNLTVSSTGGGSVTTPGEATFTYDEGEVINLVATPDADYRFIEWSGDVYTIADIDAVSTTITMRGNYEITANFNELEEEEPEVLELVFSDHHPPVGAPAPAIEAYGAYIEEHSDGKVTVEVYTGGALYTDVELFAAVKVGAVDAGSYVPEIEDGMYYAQVVNLPFMGFTSQQQVQDIFWDLCDDHPEIMEDFTSQGLTLSHLVVTPGYNLHFYEEGLVVEEPADLAGMQICAMEGNLIEILELIPGVTGIQIAFPDLFHAFEARLVDGFAMHNAFQVGVVGFDYFKSHTICNIIYTPIGILWNTESYEACLDAVGQDVMDAAAQLYCDTFYPLDAETSDWFDDAVAARGDTVTVLDATQIAAFADFMAPRVDEWVNGADNPAKAQALYDDCLALIAAY